MPAWEEILHELRPHNDESGNPVRGLSVDALRQKYMTALAQKTGRRSCPEYKADASGCPLLYFGDGKL